eukprot:6444207-Amphidinium_carterae.1
MRFPLATSIYVETQSAGSTAASTVLPRNLQELALWCAVNPMITSCCCHFGSRHKQSPEETSSGPKYCEECNATFVTTQVRAVWCGALIALKRQSQ